VTPKIKEITQTITDLLGESYIRKEVTESMLASLLLCFFFFFFFLFLFLSFYALGTLVKSIITSYLLYTIDLLGLGKSEGRVVTRDKPPFQAKGG